ncbi:CUB domain-containing protein [Trichostrongylus colubriformis]|uniref:CUB domain-containing protein n=1 Tax=Trichostrongylus colubriformis TaxID=6319 RepID=A0AAN8IVZ1_TRICO
MDSVLEEPTRPEGCGQSLVAGPDYTSFVSSVGDGTTRTKINFAKCTYWIQAPEGARIEVRIDSIQGYTVDGCIYGGVEIKAHPDQLRTGYRFCSRSSVGKTLLAASNLLPIITFNRYGRTLIGLSFRYVGEQQSGVGQTTATATTTTTTVGAATTTTAAPITTTPTGALMTTTTLPIASTPSGRCINYFYDCNILAFFGYCQSGSVRQRCRRACNDC